MAYLDIILAIPLVWGAFIGFKKGLILELATFVALILGIYGSLKFSDYTAELLNQQFEINPEWMGLISFLTTFIIIVFAIYLLAKLIDKTLKIVALGLVNRLLCLLFGLSKYALILSCLLFFFENFNSKYQFVDPNFKSNSYLYTPLKMGTAPLKSLLDEVSLETYDSLMTAPINLESI